MIPEIPDYPLPDEHGRFGDFGGQFAPETLVPALHELTETFEAAMKDAAFWTRFSNALTEVVGRPSPLSYASRLSERWGAEIYMKREDLNHTGAHKINNTVGQAILCERMGKRRIIAETGAGQHGVATATVCARMGFECIVYMGAEDIERQSLNMQRMKLLGATVVPVVSGTKTLKDAMNEAMRDWVTHVKTTHYMVGSAAGPHPYPKMVREFQRVIGHEARQQLQDLIQRCPDAVVACVGGGSNAVGLFYDFLPEARSGQVKLLGAEAAGEGIDSGRHSASLSAGSAGVLHGARTMVLQDESGQIQGAHSLAAGLDYPGVGPEHAYWQEQGYARYESVTDQEAIDAMRDLAECEGILCALETAHGVALAKRYAKANPKDVVLVGISGRGDKDMPSLAAYEQSHSTTL